MAYAALYSGGKDSNLAIWLAQERGVQVDHLVTVIPERDDSYMFHKPNLDLVPDLAVSLGMQLVTKRTKGEKEVELKDLEEVLGSLEVEGVITGAVASNYQKERIEKISDEHGMKVISPLWGMEPEDVMEKLISFGFECIIVGVAALGLDQEWLGRRLDRRCFSELMDLNIKYGINVAGEGGEYESLVLDAPNYRWGFEVEDASIKWDGHRGTYEVGGLRKKRSDDRLR